MFECTSHTHSFIHHLFTVVKHFFPQKEHYLGLLIGNDNWWRTHGIGCRLVTVGGGGSGAAADQEMEAVGSGATAAAGGGGANGGNGEEYTSCLLSYTVIETVHAALFMFLTVSH